MSIKVKLMSSIIITAVITRNSFREMCRVSHSYPLDVHCQGRFFQARDLLPVLYTVYLQIFPILLLLLQELQLLQNRRHRIGRNKEVFMLNCVRCTVSPGAVFNHNPPSSSRMQRSGAAEVEKSAMHWCRSFLCHSYHPQTTPIRFFIEAVIPVEEWCFRTGTFITTSHCIKFMNKGFFKYFLPRGMRVLT